jgi:hypothetical protein
MAFKEEDREYGKSGHMCAVTQTGHQQGQLAWWYISFLHNPGYKNPEGQRLQAQNERSSFP